MTNHSPRTMERHCDVAVVGGSAAGLAAALQIGRQRRSVIVVDAGEPRNAPAAHMHSYFGHDGKAPAELLTIGREEVRSYGGEVVQGRVIDVAKIDAEHFRLDLVGGNTVIARRVLAATGIVDELPDIPGVAEHWGGDVIHCPFCHGYEVRDQRVVSIVTSRMGLHAVPLFRQLTSNLTVVLHDVDDVADADVEPMRAAGIEIVRGRVERLVDDSDGHLAAVQIAGDRRIDVDAVAVMPRFHVRIEPLDSIGLRAAPHMSGLGDVVEVDMTGLTSVPGVYAAGNVTDPSHQVLQAAAHGSRVGGMICFSLAEEDMRAAARPSANARDWDHRYSGDQLWSGNPNGTLVHEVTDLAPGRALDVGAGEGGDAIWLAERGWDVVASDVSQRGLDRVTNAAAQRGVHVNVLLADANAATPFTSGAFDLVSAQYASVPRTADGRAVHNILGAVAPGGTLLVVGHDLEPMRAPIDTHEHSRPFDPDAYVRIEDFVAILDRSADWAIERNEKRPRPAGAASAGHHVDDVVLRARRVG